MNFKDVLFQFKNISFYHFSAQAVHVIGQMNKRKMESLECRGSGNPDPAESYRCLWDGCKVFDMISSSKTWLEKHVPTHGGKFAYACIVSGCKIRFSTQVNIAGCCFSMFLFRSYQCLLNIQVCNLNNDNAKKHCLILWSILHLIQKAHLIFLKMHY